MELKRITTDMRYSKITGEKNLLKCHQNDATMQQI